MESTPLGAQPLPEGVADFNGATSCFATTYELCAKQQRVDLGSNLIRRVLDEYRFHIYFSEWIAGRFDCGSRYGACCEMHDDKDLCDEGVEVNYEVEAWGDGSWKKVRDFGTRMYQVNFWCLISDRRADSILQEAIPVLAVQTQG